MKREGGWNEASFCEGSFIVHILLQREGGWNEAAFVISTLFPCMTVLKLLKTLLTLYVSKSLSKN